MVSNIPIESTVFHIVIPTSYENSEKIFNPERISKAISKFRTIKEWAFILHDKDTYTGVDESLDHNHKKGNPKLPHYHLIIKSSHDNKMNIKSVSKWFGIPENFIRKPDKGGDKGFVIQAIYLTHMGEEQRKLGKHEYPVEDIISNVNIESKIRKFYAQYNKVSKHVERYIRDSVFSLKLSLEEVKSQYYSYWVDHIESLKSLRDSGLKEMRKTIEEKIAKRHPKNRTNIYVTGESGYGKSIFCQTLAYLLYPEMRDNQKSLMFFTSDGGSTFQNYEYQPVIIWDEVRADDLIRNIGSRAIFLKTFDIHPIRDTRNIKYGDVALVNTYNLVNSSVSYEDFIRNILTKDEKENQFYRRFPIVIIIDIDRITLKVSRGFIDGSSNYSSLIEYGVINGSFKKLIEGIDPEDEKEDFLNVCEKIFQPVLELIHKIDEKSFKSNKEKKAIREEALKEFGL